jgi:hypothetical protein
MDGFQAGTFLGQHAFLALALVLFSLYAAAIGLWHLLGRLQGKSGTLLRQTGSVSSDQRSYQLFNIVFREVGLRWRIGYRPEVILAYILPFRFALFSS